MNKMSTAFTSILIANRGEIACRVMRTAKAMGLETVAVYSEADKDAPHVKMAGQAVCIGPAPVGESYLVIENIIKAAQDSGAQAVHPGYGFLSENTDFARACTKAGLTFIGPDPESIELMGDKAQAKRRMIKAGVPCVPGYQGETQDDKILLAESESIGFPLMVKAAAGGGGRGMRFVHDPKELPDAIKSARSEALNAFGSDILILEKAVQQPRHVEIQVFADRHGNTVYLGERDCSVQRRHQKVIEEAPCPIMTPELRARMGEAAVKASQDIAYVGAGTVEFMLEASGEFYFLEMNTRLQVEHPVTELITGLDLVALQIRVAQGEALGFTQEDVSLTGHAIEARLYAEDVSNDFLPATGTVALWEPAQQNGQGNGIRIDAGIDTGSEISPFYDPMIAKVMAFGASREEARLKLIHALKDTAIMGLTTNTSFLIDVLERPAFAKGEATTAFIGENFTAEDLQGEALMPRDAALVAVLQYELSREVALGHALHVETTLHNWTSASAIATPYIYGDIALHVTPLSDRHYKVAYGDEVFTVTCLSREAHRAVMDIDDSRTSLLFHAMTEAHIHLSIDGRAYSLVNQAAIIASAEDAAGGGAVTAPMHGALLEICVSKGDVVTVGQKLAVLEAMKMQHEILAEVDGTVTDIHVEAGVQVAADTLMIEIEESE